MYPACPASRRKTQLLDMPMDACVVDPDLLFQLRRCQISPSDSIQTRPIRCRRCERLPPRLHSTAMQRKTPRLRTKTGCLPCKHEEKIHSGRLPRDADVLRPIKQVDLERRNATRHFPPVGDVRRVAECANGLLRPTWLTVATSLEP